MIKAGDKVPLKNARMGRKVPGGRCVMVAGDAIVLDTRAHRGPLHAVGKGGSVVVTHNMINDAGAWNCEGRALSGPSKRRRRRRRR